MTIAFTDTAVRRQNCGGDGRLVPGRGSEPSAFGGRSYGVRVQFPGGRRARVARGVALSAACLVVPTVSHVVAGGGTPIAGAFLFGAFLLSVACVALADRRISAGLIAAMVFASQPVLHVLLHMSAHSHHGVGPSVSAGMVVAHAIAATALTVLLAGAESVVWSLSALSSTVLLRRVHAVVGATAAPAALKQGLPPTSAPVHPYVLSVTRTAPHRGPPLLSSI